jgi:ubiquinone biosynthesis protein UbiJ
MNPLEALLQPITRVLNRNIRESTRASELCERLDGKLIAIRVRDTGLAGYFEIGRDSLDLTTGSDGEPDVVITGSLVSLALMAGEDAIRDGSLDLTGDAATAQAFQQLLTHARPDIEEELSAVIGDTAAHGLGECARAVAQWARETRSIMGDNIPAATRWNSSRGASASCATMSIGSRQEFAASGETRDDAAQNVRDQLPRRPAMMRRRTSGTSCLGDPR